MRIGVLLIAVLLLAACGGAGRRDYVSRNDAVVASLPVFPKAVKTHEASTSYVKSESGSKPSGYTTTVVYRVPRGTTTDSILIFYTNELGRHGWQGLNTTRVLGFTKGRALVLVKPPFTGEHVYDVVVDYRGADRAG